MDKPKQDRVTNLDMRETARKAAKFQTSHAEMLNPTHLVPGITNIHPEPVHEPVMPAEVFYNKMSLQDDTD